MILFFWRSWNSIPVPLPATGSDEYHTAISVIIPARNEEEHIGKLLRALESQTYPRHLFEIIVIDDHSTDKTTEIVLQFPGVKLFQLKENKINSYKKKAIETGIAAASNELIVTTDADCIPPAAWLQSIVSFREETNAGFIVAPVSFNCNSKPVEVFQAMDFMVLQGITGASVYKNTLSMCNGANLAYEKKLFTKVGGFKDIDHIASGDDMLLMHKIAKKIPERIFYLKAKDAVVSTRPMPTWKQFLNQRIRWASKATYYDDKKIIGVLLLVYLFNFSFLILLIAGFWNHFYWIIFLIGWAAKTSVELPFFYSVAKFFNKQWAVKFFFVFQPLHIFYTIFSGLLGQFGKYEWKGRKVS
ncbi:glycosyltransferase [Terrimonas alba]|uniref:glycosyltransferase n=1 Tax=Terrimonas alba TaxID=3349636 RepID=UPI0035F492EE